MEFDKEILGKHVNQFVLCHFLVVLSLPNGICVLAELGKHQYGVFEELGA